MKNIPILNTEPIDTSLWLEFGDFFQAPLTKGMSYQWIQEVEPGFYIRLRAGVCFLSIVRADLQAGISQLREELLRVYRYPGVVVKAFLAKPSILEIDKIPGIAIYPDRKEFFPGDNKWVVFCFLYGFCGSVSEPDKIQFLNAEFVNKEILNKAD